MLHCRGDGKWEAKKFNRKFGGQILICIGDIAIFYVTTHSI